jgi:DNA-binding phage protein
MRFKCREQDAFDTVKRSMNQAVVINMRGRIEQLREVARIARDAQVAAIALKMADDIEADIQALQADSVPTIHIGLPDQQ